MNNEKALELLNSLIEINNDRIEGYETAVNETEDQDLKSLFSELKATSLHCKSELATEVVNLGGTPTEGTRTDGKLYRIWMDIKSALTGKDRKAILNSCEYGEDKAVETYQDVMRNNDSDLSTAQQAMVNGQYIKIKEGHDRVRALRDAALQD